MTASNQEAKLASLYTALGSSTLPYEGAWHAYWDDLGTVAAGTFNERMLAWINGVLGTSYINLPRAQQAYAEDQSAYNWDSLGDLGLP